jgi:hypothetical protein
MELRSRLMTIAEASVLLFFMAAQTRRVIVGICGQARRVHVEPSAVIMTLVSVCHGFLAPVFERLLWIGLSVLRAGNNYNNANGPLAAPLLSLQAPLLWKNVISYLCLQFVHELKSG